MNDVIFMTDDQAEQIVKIFENAGMTIELGAQFSVKGQIAQLLNGCEKLMQQCKTDECYVIIGDIDMATLADELPRQQARCREILENAREIGPAGAFLATMLRASLANAEKAAAAGDLGAMVAACKDLQGYSE